MPVEQRIYLLGCVCALPFGCHRKDTPPPPLVRMGTWHTHPRSHLDQGGLGPGFHPPQNTWHCSRTIQSRGVVNVQQVEPLLQDAHTFCIQQTVSGIQMKILQHFGQNFHGLNFALIETSKTSRYVTDVMTSGSLAQKVATRLLLQVKHGERCEPRRNQDGSTYNAREL